MSLSELSLLCSNREGLSISKEWCMGNMQGSVQPPRRTEVSCRKCHNVARTRLRRAVAEGRRRASVIKALAKCGDEYEDESKGLRKGGRLGERRLWAGHAQARLVIGPCGVRVWVWGWEQSESDGGCTVADSNVAQAGSRTSRQHICTTSMWRHLWSPESKAFFYYL